MMIACVTGVLKYSHPQMAVTLLQQEFHKHRRNTTKELTVALIPQVLQIFNQNDMTFINEQRNGSHTLGQGQNSWVLRASFFTEAKMLSQCFNSYTPN